VKTQRDKKSIVIFQILVLSFFCVRCFAIRDPIGDPTVPPSSLKSGLVKSPNPIDTSGNLIVTGNVRGMAYFHGSVPYRATTEFGAPLGTDSLNSFFRRSAPINLARSQLYPQPYHLPSSTVSSIAPGSRDAILTYPGINSSIRADESVTSKQLKTEQRTMIPAVSPLYDYDRTRPLSYDPTDLERVITYEQIREKNKKDLSDALQKASRGMHKIGDEDMPSLLLDKQKKEQPTQGTNLITERLGPVERLEPVKRLEPVEPFQLSDRQPSIEAKKTVGKSVYEQMLQQIAEARQSQEAQPEQQQKASWQEQAQEPEDKKPGDLRSEFSEIQKETAEAVVGIHKSFATEAKDKFNYYMRAAEKFLKQSKYYRAADAYTLAGIYKPEDPLAYAGRSHALFASGEYMSSAYFLARAIDIFPQYVNFKIDLNVMIPDKDRLNGRIGDIKQWIDKTNSAQLSFLLAYIYYQLDRLDLAVERIQFAQEQMPDSDVVKVLKQAIEKK